MFAPFVRSVDIKKIILGALLASVIGMIFAFSPAHIFAADTLQNLEAVQQSSGLGDESLIDIIGRIIKIFLGIVGVIALFIMIYAGFLWMTAAGKEDQIEKAKDIMKNGVIGIVLISLSFAITQFIVGTFSKATGFNPQGGSGKNNSGGNLILGGFDGGSPLGKIIEATDPSRNATNVARNKSIQVIFKFPIDPASVIDVTSPKAKHLKFKDEKGKDVDLVVSGPLRADNVLIYQTADGAKKMLTADQVIVFMGGNGSDLNTVIFNPIDLLGKSTANTDYSVDLLAGIQKYGTGQSVFAGYKPYSWKFTVGTEVDSVPPRVESIVPKAGGTFDRNITAQITFTEPVNLASAIGRYDGKSFLFDNLTARDSKGTIITGEWKAGSGFNIIEFTPTLECATNSCGQKVFCLPSKEVITVRAKSGVLVKVGNPQTNISGGSYTGIADTGDNALDGGGDNAKKPWSKTPGGTPKGSPDDDFFMSFLTTDATKSSAPRVTEVEPTPGTSSKVNPQFGSSSTVSITFDSLMKVTSFNDIQMNAEFKQAQAGYSKISEHQVKKDAKGVETDITKVSISHVPFAKSQTYAAVVPSTVQDIYQNCFLPSGGSNPQQGINCNFPAGPAPVNRYCCDGKISDESCTLLKYGSK